MAAPKVFLSYAREDEAAAVRLCRNLRDLRRTVWFDRDCLKGGAKWRDAIYKAIESSDFVVVLLSSASVSKRGMVQAEIRKALDVLQEIPEGEIYLIPVRLTECRPKDSRLQELHWIDLFPSWDHGVQQIVKSTEPDVGEPDRSGAPTPFDVLSDLIVRPNNELTGSVHISEAIRSTIDHFVQVARQRNIEIHFRDNAPSATVKIVRNRLVTAVANVLDNAIKYSYTTQADFSWIDIVAKENSGRVELKFENWGAGISKEEIVTGHIFSEGYRGPAAMALGRKGSGIGLAVVKAVCDEYNGTIRVESRPARSSQSLPATLFVTTVIVTFPLERRESGT